MGVRGPRHFARDTAAKGPAVRLVEVEPSVHELLGPMQRDERERAEIRARLGCRFDDD